MNPPAVMPPITEYLYRKAAASGIALSGTFELTPLCNLNCKMCYVRLSPAQQQARGALGSAEQWLSMAQQAKEAGMLYLLLTGGEPFLHPQFRQILEGLHKMGLLISINSNGTLIDEDTVAWLKQYPPVRINLSLYGIDEETYRQLCGDGKAFKRVCKAISLLQEAGIPLKLNFTLTPLNAPQLPQLIDFAKERQLPVQVAEYMFPPVRKDASLAGENFRLSPEEAAWYGAYNRYLQLGKERFLQEGCDQPMPDPDADCNDLGDGSRCRAGRCSFWITWQGYMSPCGMFPGEDRPNVFTQPFDRAWQAIKEEIAAIRLPAACSGCAARKECRACAAMVVAESGCFDKIPQYRCAMTAAYPGQWQRLKECIENEEKIDL